MYSYPKSRCQRTNNLVFLTFSSGKAGIQVPFYSDPTVTMLQSLKLEGSQRSNKFLLGGKKKLKKIITASIIYHCERNISQFFFYFMVGIISHMFSYNKNCFLQSYHYELMIILSSVSIVSV